MYRFALVIVMGLLLCTPQLCKAASDGTECLKNMEEIQSTFDNAFEAKEYDYSVVNCVSFDEEGALSNAIVSGFRTNGSVRFRFTCKGGVLLAFQSALPGNMTEYTTACLDCVDAVQPCNGTCDPECARCYDNVETCSLCTAREPPSDPCRVRCQSEDDRPNPDNDNICQLYCPPPTVINLDAYPPAEDAEELGEEHRHPSEEELLEELEDGATCDTTCDINGYLPHNGTNICFACGIEFCVECNEEKECTACIRDTALYEHHCVTGETADLATIAELQRREVEEEEEENRQTQITLAVTLPIICVAVIVGFVLMGVLAHYRYPHISREGTKRHRRATGVASPPPEHEMVWRSRPSVRLR